MQWLRPSQEEEGVSRVRLTWDDKTKAFPKVAGYIYIYISDSERTSKRERESAPCIIAKIIIALPKERVNILYCYSFEPTSEAYLHSY